MPLTTLQHKLLHSALLSSFDNAGLRLLMRQELDTDLQAVAGGQNTTEIVGNLLAWAEQTGRVNDLIDGAIRQNPTSPELQAIAETAVFWRIDPPEPEDEPPYKGLAYYDVSDAPLFFGREELTAEIAAYLQTNHFLAVVGASGSGKSSLVRAGLIAQLAAGGMIAGSEKWQVFVLTPTAAPLKSLATALTQDTESVSAAATLIDDMNRDCRSLDLYAERIASKTRAPRLLILVDQFEELFTLCNEPTHRRLFIDNLLTAASPDSVTTVVITLRADFYGHCAEYGNLRAVLQDHQNYIGAMSVDELRGAIEKPAVDGDWMLEEGLTSRLLRDVEDQPGSLPLLSHVLYETWKRRSGRILTFKGYEAAGGVQGAIAQTADVLFKDLSPDEQSTARSIFIRLTSLGEDGVPDTRRRVPMHELSRLPSYEIVLHKLENARLVIAERDSQGATFVEVAHEALIREWPQLRQWLVSDRDWLRAYRKLEQSASEWSTNGYDPQLLMPAALLRDINRHVGIRKYELTAEQRDYLMESVELVRQNEQERKSAYQKQIQKERRRAVQRIIRPVVPSILFAPRLKTILGTIYLSVMFIGFVSAILLIFVVIIPKAIYDYRGDDLLGFYGSFVPALWPFVYPNIKLAAAILVAAGIGLVFTVPAIVLLTVAFGAFAFIDEYVVKRLIKYVRSRIDRILGVSDVTLPDDDLSEIEQLKDY